MQNFWAPQATQLVSGQARVMQNDAHHHIELCSIMKAFAEKNLFFWALPKLRRPLAQSEKYAQIVYRGGGGVVIWEIPKRTVFWKGFTNVYLLDLSLGT